MPVESANRCTREGRPKGISPQCKRATRMSQTRVTRPSRNQIQRAGDDGASDGLIGNMKEDRARRRGAALWLARQDGRRGMPVVQDAAEKLAFGGQVFLRENNETV